MNQGAIAIFVKTPGLSPIKTRLGRVIGTSAAEEFYALSVEATNEVSAEAMIRASSVSLDLTAYWAIAEPAGASHHMWHQFENIFQGNDGLGERLSKVYSELLRKHDFVILIGADCPQMPWQYLIEAALFLRDGVNRFVTGPAKDGGFYLMDYLPCPRQDMSAKVVKLLYSEKQNDRSHALRRESEIKSWRRKKKQDLVRGAIRAK